MSVVGAILVRLFCEFRHVGVGVLPYCGSLLEYVYCFVYDEYRFLLFYTCSRGPFCI